MADNKKSKNLLDKFPKYANSKHNKVWDWFLKSPITSDVHFIFSDGENGDVVMTPDQAIIADPQIGSSVAEDVVTTYIDRSCERIYDFIFSVFVPISTQPNIDADKSTNIAWINAVEGLAEWVQEQNKEDSKNLPDFGEGYITNWVEVLPLPEGVSAQDDDGAKYMFGVRINYTDNTNKLTF